MLEVGQEAPDFAYLDALGNEHRLSDIRGEKSAVIYFYPRDFTPGCTKEACSFRDIYEGIQSRDIEVIGVSPQNHDSHKRFRERYSIPFPLAADTDRRIAEAYGVVGLLGLVKRVTFVVDRQGIIRNVIRAELFIGKHLKGVKDMVDELS
jgi:peroxiredoxin Q/BCP